MAFTKRPGFNRENTPAASPNVQDLLNSSTATLTSGSTFTGTWVDVGDYSDIVVSVATDQDGTYTIQFSPDGTNVDSTLTRYYRTSEINVPHRFTVTRKYYRVTFTNTSATGQTYFRLQSHYGRYSSLNSPIDSTLSPDFDAIVTRPSSYEDEVALGLRQGKTTWHKWGYNSSVDSAASETIWQPGGNPTFMTSAATLSIVSTDANDVDAGTGAHGVVVYGIDANRDSQVEVVLLNGTTPVVTSNTWLGVNRVALYRAGSGLVNAGQITATETGGTTVQATVPAGEGTTQQAIFFTQRGHTALASSLNINILKLSGGAAPRVTVKGWVLSFVSNAKYEVFRHSVDTSIENNFFLRPADRFPVGEKSVLYFTAETNTNSTVVNLRFSLIETKLVGT